MQRDLLFVGEMIDAAEHAIALVDDRPVEDIELDRRSRDALLWNLTVLGEAANCVSEPLRRRFPDVPWQEPIRLRNRIVHGYWSVDVEILHTTASGQLPPLVDSLRRILLELEADASQTRGAD